MKSLYSLVAPVVLALAACESMNAPMSSSSFDPLRPPGSSQNVASSYGPQYTPGQFVSAAIANTAFYKNEPKENQDADKLIDRGTQMKIVSEETNYLKVELDSGEVGFVPKVMVSGGESSSSDLIPVDGIYQVYPPLPDGGPVVPLPIIDPNGLPPEGSIPAIIDPNAPLDTTVPNLDTVPDLKPDETPAPPVEPDATPEAPPEASDTADEIKEKAGAESE